MVRQIKFGNNELTVKEVYPYMYQNSKEVIRIKISEDDHTYSDIEALKSDTDVIEYLEDAVTKNEYTGYTEDYRTTFCNGMWSIELKRKTEEQRTLEMHEEAILELASMIADFGQDSDDTDAVEDTESDVEASGKAVTNDSDSTEQDGVSSESEEAEAEEMEE